MMRSKNLGRTATRVNKADSISGSYSHIIGKNKAGSSLLFGHPLDCELVMSIDIILGPLVILLGMDYSFRMVFLALGLVAGAVC